MSNMQQYGASKNPPWARNATGPAMPGMQQQIMSQNSMSGMSGMSQAGMSPYQQTQSQSVYQPNLLQQQNMALGMQMQPNNVGMSTMNQGQMFSQTGVVSYPTPRALNPNAFPGSAIVGGQGSNSSPKQRVFTGTVTKAHNDFGFVDEDVFFQTSSCVKGSHPVVGDRVLVEASFNSNMPFKWNATRIQVLPTNKGGGGAAVGRDSGKKSFGGMPNSNYNAVPPPGDTHNGNFQNNQNSGRGPRPRKPTNNLINNARVGGDRGRNRGQNNTPRKDDDNTDRIRRRAERQEKDKPVEKVSEEKGKSRSLSKQRKRTRPVARYLVQVPKLALDIPEADVLAIRRRYTNLYIPSDFFNTQFRWVDAFPPNSPFTLNKPCLFHVMPKDIDNPVANDTVLEPTDVDYLFSAKVMLLSMPTLDELYRKCCAMATEEKSKDEREFIHPTRLISFLVGLRGKNETMAIGGPWSPSLDGASPATDPTVLIKTAIRTCKAHTGIDLSNCTQWYRFVELYYRRAESVHRGRVVPARVETVVVYVPDVWSCLPTRLEWDSLVPSYAARPPPPANVDQADKPNVLDTTKKEPTLYSELDTKIMSVPDLRKELWARNISTKGLKSQLVARLSKVLKREEAKDKSGEEMEVEDEVDDSAEVITIEDEPPAEDAKLDEDKQKQADKEKLFTKAVAGIPENPHVMVHPSRTAKSGKFDCTVMTLSLLLDYRQEDSKEHSFEVSLFAELFNEMLMRDFGFNIYKALYVLPDKPKEEKKKDENKDKKREDSKEKEESKDKKEDNKDKKGDDDKKDLDKKEAEKKSERKRDDKKDSTPIADDDNNSDKRSTSDKKDRKERPRLITKDAPLLLSFVYFDTTHCGYIFEKDMEELLYTLGLNLSRAQVRRLVAKVVRSDSFYYRHITDRSKEDDLEAEKNPTPEVPMKETDLSELAAGNKKLLPIFRTEDPQSDTSEPPMKRPRMETQDAENGSLVTYKGGLLDVEKLMNQLKRSEQARLDTEKRLVELKSENARLQEKQAKNALTTSTLTTNLTENKTKLINTQTQLTKSTMCTKIFFNALKDIEIKVQSVIHTNLYDDPEVVKPKGETNKFIIEVPKNEIKDEKLDINDDTRVDVKVGKEPMDVTNEDSETKPQIDTNDTKTETE